MEEQKDPTQKDDLEVQEEVIEDLEVQPEKAEDVTGGRSASSIFCKS